MRFTNLWWGFLLVALGSYLIGNINFAILYSRLKNKDIRKMGSGNPGTMNVSRTFGFKVGIITLAFDIVKGVIPTLTAKLLYQDFTFGHTNLNVGEMALFIAGFFAVLGHIRPVIYNFKGGKGIATTIGVFMVANWYIALFFSICAIVYILITEIGSMGSFIATTPSAIASLITLFKTSFLIEENFEYSVIYFVFCSLFILGIIAMTWLAHFQNIKRLIAGEEHSTNWMQMIRNFKLKNKQKKIRKKQQKRLKKSNKNNDNEMVGE